MKRQNFLIFLIFLLSACKEKVRYSSKTYLVMGTVLNVTLPEKDILFADSVYAIFKLIDSLMNPVREYSDIYRINSTKGYVRVHPLTYECIRKAIEVAEITNGAFDITVGSLVHIWHFDEYGKYIFPDMDSINKYRKLVDWRKVELGDLSVKVGDGQRITLAGIAKGFAIQKAVEYLKSKGVTSGIIDAGGDLYLLGRKGREKWRVGIKDPFTKGINRVIEIEEISCCTSGDYERYVEQNGKRYGHIFSPYDGFPVSNGVRSVTVIYGDAALCDAFATAIFVLGPVGATELSKKIPGLDYMIIMDDSTTYSPGFKEYLLD